MIGDENQGPVSFCLLWGGFDKVRHIVPTPLLVKAQRFRKGIYQGNHKTHCPLESYLVNFRRQRWLTILEPVEMKFSRPLVLFSLYTRSP